MALHERIVIARKKKGLTQEQLAGLTHVTVRTIQRIESGESRPRSYTVKAIAEVLGTSFEELTTADTENKNTLDHPINAVPTYGIDEEKHFLKMLCLSCYSFLVIPLLHFLIPARLLKKSNGQNPKVTAFARRIISVQIYWLAALYFLLLLSLAYNFVRAVYFQKTHLLNYLWPFFMMYFLNILIITAGLWQIKKADLTL